METRVTIQCSGGAGGSPATRPMQHASPAVCPMQCASHAGEPPAPRQIPEWHCRHYLPHLENKPLQFITYRLFDSVPKERVETWKRELNIRADADPNAPECQELRRRIEKYADAGNGSCFLRNERIAKIVCDNLLHHDETLYRLVDWCIMPNHVHVLIDVADGATLSGILHAWRSYTAHAANKILDRTGEFWQPEYFDRFIRNEEHLRRTIDYIDGNPGKAGLVNWQWCANSGGAGSGGAGSGGAGGPPAVYQMQCASHAGEPPAPRQGGLE